MRHRGNRQVADRVNPGVDRDQPPAGDPVLDVRRRQPELQQLPAGGVAVLTASLSALDIGLTAEQVQASVRIAAVVHAVAATLDAEGVKTLQMAA